MAALPEPQIRQVYDLEGEEVDAGEYIFRAATRIEASAAELAWLNEGIFISVGGRSSGGVAYDTYVVEW